MKDPKNQRKRIERRDDLISFLPASGMTISEIVDMFGVSRQLANMAIRDVRLFFGEDAEVNLIAVPQGIGQEWLYQWSVDDDDLAKWLKLQGKNIVSRLETNLAMALSDARRFKGQTNKYARAARLRAKVYARLAEDHAEIMSEV